MKFLLLHARSVQLVRECRNARSRVPAGSVVARPRGAAVVFLRGFVSLSPLVSAEDPSDQEAEEEPDDQGDDGRADRGQGERLLGKESGQRNLVRIGMEMVLLGPRFTLRKDCEKKRMLSKDSVI